MKHSTNWTIDRRSKVRNFYLAAALGLFFLSPAAANAHGSEVHATPVAPTAEVTASAEPADTRDAANVESIAALFEKQSSHDDMEVAAGDHDDMGEAPHAQGDQMQRAAGDHDDMGETPHAHGDQIEGTSDHIEAGAAPHDHASHSSSNELLETAFGRLLFWLGKLHPAAVHFPIAMLLGAAFAELASLRFKPDFFRNAARYSLWVGTLGAVGAALLGWFYGGFRLVDEENILTLHRWNGTTIALLSVAALWLAERRVSAPSKSAMPYRTLLFAVALMAGLNGYWGGVMVYGPEQHQWPEIPAPHGH